MPKRLRDLWRRDSIQFPRLLAEIWACGLTIGQLRRIAESMDVDEEQVIELFERADRRFQQLKQKHCPPRRRR